MRARRYTSQDYDTCVALFRSNVPIYFAEAEEADLRDFLDDLFGDYFVFEERDEAVACGGIYIDQPERWVGIIWTIVRGDSLGQGFGRQMFALLMDQIPESQREYPVYLDTSQHSLGFWEKMGFRVYEQQTDGYGPGLHRYDMKLDPSAARAPER